MWKSKIRCENCRTKTDLLASIPSKHNNILRGTLSVFYSYNQEYLVKTIARMIFLNKNQ